MKIDLLGLFTDQFEPMKRFYTDVLQMEPCCELESYVEFSGQGVRFSICERKVMVATLGEEHFGSAPTGKAFSLAFRSNSPAAVATDFEALIQRGATAVQAPAEMPWGQVTAFFADPDGNCHEVFADLPTDPKA